MGDDDIDPGSLSGDALTQWYLRSPDEIERARQAAYTQRYNNFFGSAGDDDPDPGFAREVVQTGPDVDPGFSRRMGAAGEDIDPGFTWVQDGPNRLRSVPVPQGDGTWQASVSPSSTNDGAIVDKGLAGPNDGADIIDVGNPANPKLRRQWEIQNGQSWPKDPATGRNHDVAHIIAKADGGTDTLDNIRPLHPDLHKQEHMQNGDFARWGARSRAAGSAPTEAVPRLPGGEIPRFKVPGIGLISPLSDILGMISGRIRTDSADNFASDMMGIPSQEDLQRQRDYIQKQLFPQAKPGEKWA